MSFVKEWLKTNTNAGKSDDDAIARTVLFRNTAFEIEAYISGLEREREDEHRRALLCLVSFSPAIIHSWRARERARSFDERRIPVGITGSRPSECACANQPWGSV